jgi:tetratricopeptide (TPR) repeat protein
MWRRLAVVPCVALVLGLASGSGLAPGHGVAPGEAVDPAPAAARTYRAGPHAASDLRNGGADLFRPARARALVIGAGDYERLGRLKYARSDAAAFAETLTDELGFARDDVRLLVDGEGADPLRTPTLGHVRTELADLLADPARGSTDLFVLFFSGHGVAAEGGDYLLPTDVGPNNAREDGLPVRELVRQLTDGGARNVLLVLDACRDGARNTFGSEVLELADDARLGVLLSAGPGQVSYEVASKGAGLFTHYLVRALRSRESWDTVSGALWISEAARAAAQRVREYTAEDFDVPQVPELHLPPGEDILLAAAPPTFDDPQQAAFFAAERVAHGGDAYLAAVSAYAQALYLGRRYEECVRVLEAAEQLEPLPPDLGYALVRSLFVLGRTGEGRRALERLRVRHPDAYGTLAATVQDLSGVLPMQERVAAARQLLVLDEAAKHSAGERAVVAALLALKDGASGEETAAAAQRYVASAPEDSHLVWVGRALLASMQGHDAEAVSILEEAEAALPPGDERVLARIFLWQYLEGQGDPARLLGHLARWIGEDDRDGRWLAKRASLHAALGDRAAARADARAALRRGLAPEDVILAVRAAGFGALALGEEVDRQLELHPNAWEVVLARLFVRQSAPEGAETALDRLEFTSGRRVHLMALLSELELGALEDGVATGEAEVAELDRYRWSLLERTVEGAGRFEGDAAAWWLLVRCAVHLDRTLQAARAVRHHLGATIVTGELAADLTGPAALVLLASGDLELLGRIRSVLPESLPQRASLGWFEVALRGLRDAEGDRGAALELATTLGAPGSQAEGVADAWRGLVAARAGDGEAARRHLAALDGSSNAIALALAAATHETLGEHRAAQHCYDLVLAGRVPLAPYLRPLCLTRVAAAGSLDGEERADLAFLASREGPGNPLYERLSCLAAPDVAAFVGAHTFEVEGDDGPEGAGDTLRLFIAEGGRVDGFLTRKEGAPRTLEGRIDGWGNLQATVGGAATPTELFAKLATPPVRREHATWSALGQLFLLLDETGRSSVWVGR